MSDTKYIFGNWKMNLGVAESADLMSKIAGAKRRSGLEIAVFPNFAALPGVFAVAKGGGAVKIGGQDCFWEERGAYTGEVSVSHLKELGCTYVLIGHSERRTHLGETDEMINKKIRVAQKAGIVPVLCVGESDDERRAGLWAALIQKQIAEDLSGITLGGEEVIFIAYEPKWAIGTGRACEPKSAREAHSMIVNALAEIYGFDEANRHFRIIYGGSVDATNIASYLSQEGIDGALVGGASQKHEAFSALLDAAATAASAK